jgi:hypothetical protein
MFALCEDTAHALELPRDALLQLLVPLLKLIPQVALDSAHVRVDLLHLVETSHLLLRKLQAPFGQVRHLILCANGPVGQVGHLVLLTQDHLLQVSGVGVDV